MGRLFGTRHFKCSFGSSRLNRELCRESDENGKGVGLDFSHDACSMDLDSVLGDPELKSDLLIQQAANQQRQHLSLSGRQGLISSREARVFDRFTTILAALLNCSFNR